MSGNLDDDYDDDDDDDDDDDAIHQHHSNRRQTWRSVQWDPRCQTRKPANYHFDHFDHHHDHFDHHHDHDFDDDDITCMLPNIE